jgi:RHS repeat-associated protein
MHDSILAGNIWQGRGTYDVRLNPTLTGSVTYADITHASSIVGVGGSQTLGRGVLSSEGVQNRFGYAGYRYDHHLSGGAGAGRHLYHVRHRVYQAHIGRWATRDPLGYVDGMGLYEYVQSRPLVMRDTYGLAGSDLRRTSCPAAPNDWPDCVNQSTDIDSCLQCCVYEDQSHQDCAEACFAKWPIPPRDPRLDPIDWGQCDDSRGNCWRYAICDPLEDGIWEDHPQWRHPGHNKRPGNLPPAGSCTLTCDMLRDAVRQDVGAVDPAGGNCPPYHYKIMLMLATTPPCDFHFYREEPDGSWTDKIGCNPPSRPFEDPIKEFEERQQWRIPGVPNYNSNCGFMCVPFARRTTASH